MAYIGNIPAEQYATLAKQTITGNGGAFYTLDYAVANEQEIEVFVNNVRQEPGVAYTVSGTALTMTGNVASTDDFYVVFQGKTVGTIVPGDDTITTAMLKANSVTSAKVDSTVLTSAATVSSVPAMIAEGTWTPVANFDTTNPTAGGTTGDGFYQRVGNLVTVMWWIVNIDVTGASGNLVIQGLPYNTDSVGNMTAYYGTSYVNSINIAGGSAYDMTSQCGGNQIYIRTNEDNTTAGFIDVAKIADGVTDLRGTVTYYTTDAF